MTAMAIAPVVAMRQPQCAPSGNIEKPPKPIAWPVIVHCTMPKNIGYKIAIFIAVLSTGQDQGSSTSRPTVVSSGARGVAHQFSFAKTPLVGAGSSSAVSGFNIRAKPRITAFIVAV